jgi:hypothetical protein
MLDPTRVITFALGLLFSAIASAASSNADLETMMVRATGGATLSPAFSPSQTQYAMTVPSDIAAVHIRGSAWNGRSKLKINDQSVASLDWRRVPLKVGGNRISFDVVAPDGVASRTYVIDVEREDTKPVAEQFLRFMHRDDAIGMTMPYRLFDPQGAG